MLLWVVLLLASGATAEEDLLEAMSAVLKEATGQDRSQMLGSIMAAFAGASTGGSQDPIQGLMSSLPGLAAMLPALMNQGHRHSEDAALEDPDEHAQHDDATALLLSFLSSLWDRFKNTDLAKALWTDSGLSKFVDTWASRAGSFQPDMLFDALSNPTFRKNWVSPVVASMAHWITHLNNPDVQKKYTENLVAAANEYLESQGWPRDQLLDTSQPLGESLAKLADSVAAAQLGMKVNTAEYIQPAVQYLTEGLKVGRGQLEGLSEAQVEDSFTQALNVEVIDAILRVRTAYEYSKHFPACDKQILCLLNRSSRDRLAFRPAITKGSSLVAAWFLSGHTGTPFLTLHGAVTTESNNCQKLYPADCSTWHEEDMRITPEYAHNEL